MKLIGVARLGNDPELRSTNSDKVMNLSLAYNYGQKDSSGNRATQWVDAALWGKRAEALADFLRKGRELYVEVRDVHIETYDKRDGGTGVKLVGTVNDIQLVGSSRDNQGSESYAPEARPAAPARAPAPVRAAASDDDDIPF